MISLPAFITLAQDIRLMPENFGSVEFRDQTTLHPLGLAMTLVCGIALLIVPRRFAVWPFIILACFVSTAQRLVVGSLDFNLVRILVLFAVARLLLRAEYRGIRWRALDYLIVIYAISMTALFTIQQSSVSALIYQSGVIFDSVGVYFLMRCFLRNPKELSHAVLGFALVSIPVAIAFMLENQTGRNVFSAFGGVPEITKIRQGRLRCQGAFAHPIIGGCFWAASLPLIASLWWRKGSWCLAATVGTFCALAAVLLSASSTPVMGVLMALLAGSMFFIRHWVRWVFFGTCLLAVGLHLSMKAPVWHLISRITISKGNTGYHRFQLIDNAINRFDEWWLTGTRSTAHWFWGGQDVTNQYVIEGVRGGFLTLVLFVTTIAFAFIAVGRTWRLLRTQRQWLVLSWALGVALFVHCTSFIGVSYFGQTVLLWYLHLAMIASLDEYAVTYAERSRVKPSARRQTPRSAAIQRKKRGRHVKPGGLNAQ